MAKEKFARSKPHVNIGSWFKDKLGFGATPGEPPMEPLEPEASRLGAGFNPEEALGASALEHTDSEGVPEVEDGWQQPAFGLEAPPDPADPDKIYRVKVTFPNPEAEPDGGESPGAPGGDPMTQPGTEVGADEATGQNQGDDGSSHWVRVSQLSTSGSMAEQTPPTLIPEDKPYAEPPGEGDETPDAQAHATEKDPLTSFLFGLKIDSVDAAIEPDGLVLPDVDDEVLVAFEQGDLSQPVVLGGLWNGNTAPPPNAGLEADEASDAEIEHSHEYQHNQTDLEFLKQRAAAEGDADKVGLQKLDNSDSSEAHGDPDQPLVLGRVSNPGPSDSSDGADAPGDAGMTRVGNYPVNPPPADDDPDLGSTLVDLETQETPSPIDPRVITLVDDDSVHGDEISDLDD